MRDQFSNSQQIRKPAVSSKGGIVAAQSRKAAEVGASVLAAGGDCIDAVIATTFALGVLEPWMSGLGGGGAMVLYRAREDRTEVIDYGMRAPGSLRIEDYPLTGDGAASDLFPWAAGEGRPQSAWSRLDRRARRGRRHGRGASPSRHAAVEGIARPERKACRRRTIGRLVDYADDCEFGCRPATVSCERCRLSAGRPAAECSMGHQVQRAPAAGPAQGDAVIPRRRRPARFLPGRSGAQHRGRHSGSRRRAVGRRPRRLPRPWARGADHSVSRRPCLRDAGADLRPDAGAYLAPAAAETAARPRRAGCDVLHGICPGAAIGLPRTAAGHGRRRRQPRARRRASGAGLHHAFLGGRPRGQHGGGDTNAALDLRLEIRHAADRRDHEQRHHVVRPDARPVEFAGARKTLPDQLHAGAGAGRRWPPSGARRLRRDGASCRR